jgi:hypothetical protein
MHKRLSRAVVLLIVLAAEVFAQPNWGHPGGCTTNVVASAVLVRGTGKELKTQFMVGADCDGTTFPSDCDAHYYADLYYSPDNGANWYSMWNSQYTCMNLAHDCADGSWVQWIPSSTTFRTTTGFPGKFVSEIWVYQGNCIWGDGSQVDHRLSDEVVIVGP